MLSRVRREYSGGWLRIPRKGRIRAVLALLVVIATIRLIAHHPPDASASRPRVKPAAGPTRRAVPVVEPTRRMQAVSAEKEPRPSFAFPFLKKETRRIASPQLSELLSDNSPSLASAIDTIRNRGRILVVHTSIDPVLQEYAQRLMKRYKPRYGASVAMEPSTGRILTLASFTGDSQPSLGERLYCRSLFPAASIFKTVTAAAAIEKRGLGPESTLRHVGRNHTLYKFQLKEELEAYRDITLTEAYAYSVNPVFGRIGLFLVGCEGLRDYARRFGFTAAVPFRFPVDTAQLGPCDSSYALAELASGFNQATTLSPLLGAMIASAIADGGVMMQPSLVDSVVNLTSFQTAFRASATQWGAPIRPSTAADLRRMMVKVVYYGTARESFRYLRNSFRFRDMQYGGKTGSVDKEGLGRVDWFIGFIRDDSDPRRRLATSVVTVHGDNWTVHSSFVAAELMRVYIREIQRAGDDVDAVARPDPVAPPARSGVETQTQGSGG
jgi:membrane peptidoglycan carboxypeptidase